MNITHILETSRPVTTPDYSFIGNRIREARKDAGFTQTELADEAGLSQAMINKLEAGGASLTLDNLFKFSEILRQPIIYFLGIGTRDLSAEEAELIQLYRSIKDPGRQKSVRAVARTFIEIEGSQRENGDSSPSD